MRVQLSRRTDYAVRAMMLLAQKPEQVMSGASIASQTDIPPRLVVQIMGQLARAGLVDARLGRSGGYRLHAAARSIPMLSIVEAIEGPRLRPRCVLRGIACPRAGACVAHEVFAGAQDAYFERLTDTSLDALVG